MGISKIKTQRLIGLFGILFLCPFSFADHKKGDSLSCSFLSAEHEAKSIWHINNQSAISSNIVTWTISATKLHPSHSLISISGKLRLHNTGKEPMRIGNMALVFRTGAVALPAVINVLDSVNGDAATSIHICQHRNKRKEISIAESSSSGTIRLLSASSNQPIALSTIPRIQPHSHLDLEFKGNFKAQGHFVASGGNASLEVLATVSGFGSSGDPEHCAKMDIDGDSIIVADEKRTRTLSCQMALSVPPAQRVNDQMILESLSSEVTGQNINSKQVTLNEIGQGSGAEIISDSTIRKIVASVVGGPANGQISACARLQSINPSSADIVSCSSQVVNANSFPPSPPPSAIGRFLPGQYCAYDQSGWGGEPTPGSISEKMYQQFDLRFQSGSLQVGSYQLAIFTSPESITSFLPVTQSPGVLLGPQVNPSSETEAGKLLGEVLTLRLNLSGIGYGSMGTFGILILKDTRTVFDGMDVYQIFQIAQDILGGSRTYPAVDTQELTNLLNNLNNSFGSCTPNQWALDHLDLP